MVYLIPKFYSTKSGQLHYANINLIPHFSQHVKMSYPRTADINFCDLENSKCPRKGPPDLYNSPLLTDKK